MKLVNDIIKKYGTDKVLHFSVCGWIESICCFLGTEWMLWGLLVVAMVSLLKELLDEVFDWNDFIAGELGAMIAGAVYFTTTFL